MSLLLARNHWIDGAHNRSTIQGVSSAGPDPVEFLLHSLAACLTTSLVSVAAARKVRLTEVESVLEGELDTRGAVGRNGFSRIRVRLRVAGDAPAELLRELVERTRARSSVFDATGGVPMELEVATG